MPELDRLNAAVARPADSDEAWRQLSTPDWVEAPAFCRLHRAFIRAADTRAAVRDASRPQPTILRQLLQDRGDASFHV